MKNLTFGGSLCRDVAALPGLGDKFVTVSRKFPKGKFPAVAKVLTAAFSHVNADEITDDFGKVWPPESLLHLGADGREDGKTVLLVLKFVPISALYAPVSFGVLRDGEAF